MWPSPFKFYISQVPCETKSLSSPWWGGGLISQSTVRAALWAESPDLPSGCRFKSSAAGLGCRLKLGQDVYDHTRIWIDFRSSYDFMKFNSGKVTL